MSISIVIPNYNGEKLLEKNLPKVLAAKKDAEVIVVDDGSTDSSLEVLKKFDVKVIVNKKNLGFSSTVNRGVSQAEGDIVVLLNTDVLPEKDFLQPLLKHFEDPKVFAVGCMDKSIEGDTVVLRGRGIGKWQQGFLVHAKGEVDKMDTLWASGGSSAFRKSLWEKLGGLDELYNPFYWEDIDFSYRALKSGYKIVFESKSIVTHEHSKGVIKKTYSTLRVKTIAYRNQFIFVWKNLTDTDLWFKHVFWFLYHFGRAFIDGDWAFFGGFLSAFALFPSIVLSRRKVQRFFIRKDRDIVNEIT